MQSFVDITFLLSLPPSFPPSLPRLLPYHSPFPSFPLPPPSSPIPPPLPSPLPSYPIILPSPPSSFSLLSPLLPFPQTSSLSLLFPSPPLPLPSPPSACPSFQEMTALGAAIAAGLAVGVWRGTEELPKGDPPTLLHPSIPPDGWLPSTGHHHAHMEQQLCVAG